MVDQVIRRPASGVAQSDTNRVGYFFAVLPVLVHVWMVYRFATNMPYLDDYTFIVDALNLKTAHLTAGQLLKTIFYPHGEHVIVFARLTALFDYLIEGELNFRTLFFVGNATLLGTAWLLYRIARRGGLTVVQTLPIFYLLFQPQYYENTMTWAICSLQHIPALFFAFGAFYLLAQSSGRSFLLSLPLAFLAMFSNGNGLAVLVVGLGVVLLRRQRQQVLVWLVFSALCGWLYYYLSQFSAAAPVSGNLAHPLRVLGGFFLMSGSMGLLFTRSLAALSLLGIALTTLFGIVISTTLIRYTGYTYWLQQMPIRWQRLLHTWSTPAVKPVSIVLIACYLYLVITLVGIAFARGQGWHYGLLLPRFIWFATVGVVVGYLLLLLWLRSVYRYEVGWGVLYVSLFFNGAAYWLTTGEMLAVRGSLVSDAHNWRENHLLNTLPTNKRDCDTFYAALMTAALREGVYQMPAAPALIGPVATDRSVMAHSSALITHDSSFSLDDRRYRYLTLADDALPKGPFICEDAYLLLRSEQHTFVWPINQSPTKLAQFLLTGRSPRNGPLAVVMTDLLPPASYRSGISYNQNGRRITTFSNQQLVVAGRMK